MSELRTEQAASLSAEVPWWREVTPDGWRALTAAGLGWLFEVYDIFILALTIPALIAVFSLSHEEAGAIGSLLALGLIIGGIFFGWVADRIGRVWTLFISILVYSVFTGLTVFAPSVGWVMLLRFLAGFGMGGEWTAGAALVAETWTPRHRGKGGALMQMGLPLGSMLAILVVTVVATTTGGLQHGSWRLVYALGALPALLLFYVARRTPESPVWRAQRNKPEAEHSGIGDLLKGSNARGLVVAFAFIFCAQYIYWGVFTWTPTFLVVVKHFAFVHSLTFIFSQQIGSLLGFLIFASLVDRIGRRPTFLLYLIVGAAGVVLLILGSGRLAILLATFLSGAGITGLFAGMGPYTAELVPTTSSRGLAMGFAYNGGRLGGFIAPFLVGALATGASGFKVGFLTTIVAFVLAVIVIAASPETKGTVIS